MVPRDTCTPEEHYLKNLFIPVLKDVRLWLRFKDKPMYTLQLFVLSCHPVEEGDCYHVNQIMTVSESFQTDLGVRPFSCSRGGGNLDGSHSNKKHQVPACLS